MFSMEMKCTKKELNVVNKEISSDKDVIYLEEENKMINGNTWYDDEPTLFGFVPETWSWFFRYVSEIKDCGKLVLKMSDVV